MLRLTLQELDSNLPNLDYPLENGVSMEMDPYRPEVLSDAAVNRSDVQMQVLCQDNAAAQGGHNEGNTDNFEVLASGQPMSPPSTTNETPAVPRNFKIAEQRAFMEGRRLLTLGKTPVFISYIAQSQQEDGWPKLDLGNFSSNGEVSGFL